MGNQQTLFSKKSKNQFVQTSISNINEFMRPEFLSKNKTNVYRSQDEYFPTFLKGERTKGPFNSSKKPHHIRSSSNLLEEGHTNNLNIQSNNQQHFLPKIGQLSTKHPNFTASKSIDQLQVYVHHLLLKNLKQHKENRQIKSIEKQNDKKKVDLTKKEEQAKIEKESTRMQQLRLKLTQLYGEMTLEQNKLKIQISVEEKMEKKFTNFYEHIAKRFKRGDLVETGQNTQIATIVEAKKSQKNVNSKNLLSKFRVIGYAVLFALFFPKYSSSFKQQRKKHFDKIINESKSLEKQLNNCHKLFEEIKLKSFWKKLQSKNGQSLSSIKSQNKSLSSNNSSEQEANLPNENKIFQALRFILQNILEAIKLGKIDQLIKISSLSLSNRSYLADQLFLLKQLKNIKIDKNNNFLLLEENQQKILIINLLVIKLTAFSFMINNRIVSKNNQQYIFQNKQNGKYQNLSFTIAKYIQRAGLYLIDLCNKWAFSEKQSTQTLSQGNLKEVEQHLLPLPMPQLRIEGRKIIRSNKSLDKRTSIEILIKNGGKSQEQIQIQNCENIRQKMKKIPQQVQNSLLQLIKSIKEEVYVRFANFKRSLYQQFSLQAFKNIKKQQTKIFPSNNHNRSPQQLEILHQLYLHLNKDTKPNMNTISQSQKQDQLSQKSNQLQQNGSDSQSPSNKSQSNELKETESRTQSL